MTDTDSRPWHVRFLDIDIVYNFCHSPVAVGAGLLTLVIVLSAACAPFIAPHSPFDLTTFSLIDAEIPPAWMEDGDARFLVGTDAQGRDLLSLILYGSRISLVVGFLSILFAMALGVTVGLISGFVGGTLDAVLMRVADVQLSFPAILIALLVDGLARAFLPDEVREASAIYVLIFAIGISKWVIFARTVRGSAMIEKNKEYVQAARIIGRKSWFIMAFHVLPNCLGPILVIATINLALAVLTEATLSFLGVGLPPTSPSLGTLIRIGNEYLFSGLWWITIFPGAALVLLVLSVNLLGDWLRDALNPKLR
ncbi:MAG: ABC transporter permease [Alphaproteobacteria bacterium]|nr:ABC transporter permease [Alphaproteobacteria bacterium]